LKTGSKDIVKTSLPLKNWHLAGRLASKHIFSIFAGVLPVDNKILTEKCRT